MVGFVFLPNNAATSPVTTLWNFHVFGLFVLMHF